MKIHLIIGNEQYILPPSDFEESRIQHQSVFFAFADELVAQKKKDELQRETATFKVKGENYGKYYSVVDRTINKYIFLRVISLEVQ